MLLIGSLMMVNTASADTTYQATLTGYTFMGAGAAQTSTPDGPSNQKDYFKASPMELTGAFSTFYGYSWVKFQDIGTETVASAYLALDLLEVGNMVGTPAPGPASPTNPGILDIYNPGATDVADLAGSITSPLLRRTLRNNLLNTNPVVDNFTMTANGIHLIDITDTYNGWVNGSIANHGLILTTNTDGAGMEFASFGKENHDAPYIVTAPVPVPGAFLLMACGLISLIGFTRSDR